MCGIAGILNLNGKPVCPQTLKRMTDAISHRGPDGEGHWIEREIGLGHRRLSIIDLSDLGKQPMHSSSQRYVISYNGEVYNFSDIKRDLQALGYKFRSTSDTEIVLSAFEEWGVHAFTLFNGMFACAIWDRKERCLILGRDRYGIKPLYFTQQNGAVAFASEQKALLTLPDFKRDLDTETLYEYLTFQNIFTNKTLLQDISLLPAGHFATLHFDRGLAELKLTKYWDYNFCEPDHKVDEREYVEEIRSLFIKAVNRQLVSDVPVGSYLSGGMDSGSITAIASKSIPNLNTFTCGFDLSSASGLELAFDERSKAEALSAIFKTEHYEMVLKAGDMERCLPLLAHHLEEPRVGQSYPIYYAANLASKFVKVVLSGAGGDELFGGYPWRYYRAVNNSNFDSYVNKYFEYWQRLTTKSERLQIFNPIYNNVKHIDPKHIFSQVFSDDVSSLTRPSDYINHSLYFEAKTFLHGLFVVEDKLAMAHGLETRVPFMDNELVNFAMRCPVSLKLNNLSEVVRLNENDHVKKVEKYFQRTADGKKILREMMSELLPDHILSAPKQGFSSPDNSWFKGESIKFVKSKLSEKSSIIYNFLDFNFTQSLIKQHLDGTKNRRLLIWSLLNLDQYLNEVL